MVLDIIQSQSIWIDFIVLFLSFSICAYFKLHLLIWSSIVFIFLYTWQVPLPLFVLLFIFSIVFSIPWLRKTFITQIIAKIILKFKLLPHISETEEIALRSGTTWIDADIFSGKLNIQKLLDSKYTELTKDEQNFINNEVQILCKMVNDWEVFQQKKLPDNVWKFLKKKQFLGMIIPKKYGGLGFSAEAHSQVIAKLSSHCAPLAITVMVPNSLGPAELLVHYGTQSQRDYYLPRLANGEEIPCFGLTEPLAGSDAGSIISSGEIVKLDNGKLGIKLNWEKRYITLGAIATIIGLAFKLKDPDYLLGEKEDLGITCALIPRHLKGINLGRRHDPLGVPFYNSPIEGKNVIISIEDVIGGEKGLGNGWKMLMESLAAGRGISLPATSTGSGQMATKVVSAYTQIREQFGLPIAKFEGIEEAMARVSGFTYLMTAARKFVTGAIDEGKKPSVITAISKYHFTELGRKVINDSMDILGGSAISRGPRNTLAHAYMNIPIGITVEGANIMTRTLIHFGQGLIRCNPYLYKQVDSLNKKDYKLFDKALWNYFGSIIQNKTRAFFIGITHGFFSFAIFRKNGKHYRRIIWATALFAFMVDVGLLILGGGLKRKEKISGRYGDILSWIFLCIAVLKYHHSVQYDKRDQIYVNWIVEYGLYQIKLAFLGIFNNLTDNFLLKLIFKYIYSFLLQVNSLSTDTSDKLGHQICSILMKDSSFRSRLTNLVFLEKSNQKRGLDILESTLELLKKTETIRNKLKIAIRNKQLPKESILKIIDEALEKNIISKEDYRLLKDSEEARYNAILVDEYTLDSYFNHEMKSLV